MHTFLLIIHVLVCVFLIFIVLIQSGKGAELGAAFGGSSQTLFGARGAATVFSKLTTIAAVIFMLTSLTLAMITAKSRSVVTPAPVTQERKAIPPAPGAAKGPLQGVQPQSAPAPAPAQPAKSK
ncbi:MAG: preprotein translocase subunit SecG [Candidatus Sulfobium sp.]|jgi:preprotein translocase subunit SecG